MYITFNTTTTLEPKIIGTTRPLFYPEAIQPPIKIKSQRSIPQIHTQQYYLILKNHYISRTLLPQQAMIHKNKCDPHNNSNYIYVYRNIEYILIKSSLCSTHNT